MRRKVKAGVNSVFKGLSDRTRPSGILGQSRGVAGRRWSCSKEARKSSSAATATATAMDHPRVTSKLTCKTPVPSDIKSKDDESLLDVKS